MRQQCCRAAASAPYLRWGRRNLVVGMTNSSPVPHLASEFDAFLFAPVGADGNGVPLTVLSTLARSDLDPWQEAARLTETSGKIATERLAWLIASLPGRPSTLLDSRTIAARLVALLPPQAGSNIRSPKTLLDGGAATNSRAVIYWLLYVIFMTGVS